MYNETVKDHFQHPRNAGELEDADGIGEVGDIECGDIMRITLRIEQDVITAIRFKTFGCAAAIATSSMVTELANGKTLQQALRISNADVAAALGGLPEEKLSCSNLAADALHAAIRDYRSHRST
ncbi:iron-sulfur cluster assembly scaffold protein [Geothermobacter hydrogeniphilus]|uniref:Iron-sulfur cluster assembly scaffold protein n=1 Tax=Geothermobacter hydrogeniphilus TaxID=1969733 RepID=A0A2K2HDB6_9BACT|nr:iron-sulfur cluster assembly scaffold protein [Geothermobacter hydrogeniphilus]PNU21274.1 iron-sulfur cluster assembly scaffold protein [Geothermobacter hydrogeniphilus]